MAPTFGAPGLLATGGGPGLGFDATGGLGASALPGRELVGVVSLDPFVAAVVAVFFHGVAEPFDGAMPGKTAIGFAEGSAEMDFGAALAAGAAGVTETGRRFAGGGGGGGGGTGAALGFGGMSSR